MKKLEKEFIGTCDVKGILFKQIECTKKGFIYEVTNKERNSKYYEVFKRKKRKTKERTINNSVIKEELKEIYPTTNDFGLWAWTTVNKDKAINILNTL